MRIDDMPKDCIRTYSGLLMNVFEPTIEMINEVDIAHALSNQPRFAGHLPKFYSVAQHVVLCMRLASEKNKKPTLFHDGSEGYLLDIPTPIKARMPEYKIIEDKLMSVIAKKFNFEYPFDKEIKEIDRYMLKTEWSNMVEYPNEKFICWTPEQAKDEFLLAYNKIKLKESSILV